MRFGALALIPLALACAEEQDASAPLPADSAAAEALAAAPDDAVLRFTGTEPFWGGRVAGGELVWSTPENIDGTTIAVTRFEGLGGVSFSGELEGEAFDLTLTPGACSDGMSDRTYPLVATVRRGDETLAGCGWREGDVLDPAQP